MHPLVREYRSLPPSSDHLPDHGPNDRKTVILRELDANANDPDVSQLLLDVLRDPKEFDLARVEAVQVAEAAQEAQRMTQYYPCPLVTSVP